MNLPDELLDAITDPVDRLLLTGAAETAAEAEEMYLDAALPEALALLAGPMSDDELVRHPLMRLYLSRGSRPWEDEL